MSEPRASAPSLAVAPSPEPAPSPAGETPEARNRFGTFGGVFTPAILTILGVIMFMRANFVVGQAGILHAVLILLIAKSITFTTSLSIAAIATNMQVRGGGAYYMISRVLGPEFGGAIGIALFFALALSVPFYILGFTEALCRSFEPLSPYFQLIAMTAAAIFLIVAYRGAGGAIKTQYVIMAFLFLSIVSFLGGAISHFSAETFRANWASGYTPLDPAQPGLGTYTFWIVFAIYFPAVTGIDAGVNMSGDLKDPGRSLPRGTLAAVGVGFAIYLSQMLLCGGAYDRADMIATPYQLLRDNAVLGSGFFVMCGVFAATLSSALGSYMSAPRVLQAVSRDPILAFLRPFAKGAKRGDEPRRALVAVGVLTFAVLLWAGNESGGAALNIVAAIVTMFFLYCYGMMNLAAFIEAFGQNPSFRPRFRFFHWTTALLGSAGCVVVAVLIEPVAAVGAVVLIAALYIYVRTRQLKSSFGDARRGFVFASARKNLLQLEEMPEDLRNWRPTILVFTGNPTSREAMISYAVWLEAGRGVVFLANILVGEFDGLVRHRRAAVRQLRDFCLEKGIQAFPVSLIAENLGSGVAAALQTAAIGPLRPNVASFGWSATPHGAGVLVGHLRTARALGMNLALFRVTGLPLPRAHKRIDVWWRGQKNGAVMLLLAYLLRQNWEWTRSRIRVLRVVETEPGRAPAREALTALVRAARVDADAEVIVSDRPFEEILHRHSGDAACAFLGFEPPVPGEEAGWFAVYESFLAGMPTCILVSSVDDGDVLA